MNKTGIEWCDYTWNPIVGCSPASAGCDNCYAEVISKRFHLPWGKPHFMPDRLDQPAKVKKPGRMFVCSMSDMFHEGVNPAWRQDIYQAMLKAPWHQYIILTKRPCNIKRFEILGGVWVGVTIESNAYRYRFDALETVCDNDVLFVSAEPMIGPVDLGSFTPSWVIAGPETGPKARECQDAWIESLATESPCFFDKRGHVGARREWPA